MNRHLILGNLYFLLAFYRLKNFCFNMGKNKLPCPTCKNLGKEVSMVEKDDMLVCPERQTAFQVEEISPLGRYGDNWKNNAEEIYPLLRPELNQADLPNIRLFLLYEDCYHTLLIGRYNASIVLMGVLLEALMKERIMVKLGIDFTEPYGACLKKIEDEKMMRKEDIKFLRDFKDMIRNPYQHADESKILQGVFIPVFPLQFVDKLSLEKLEQVLKNIKSGKLKPKLLHAADIPAIRSITKQEIDRRKAVNLFNQVYDFLQVAQIRYFKKEDYEEHHRKFGTGLEKVEHYKV